MQELLEKIKDSFNSLLDDNLIGIYLHGSIAMGCFSAKSSDIDFLVVTKSSLTLDNKKQIGGLALQLSESAPPKGIEFSILTLEQLCNFHYPTPFELHFSNIWKDKFKS